MFLHKFNENFDTRMLKVLLAVPEKQKYFWPYFSSHGNTLTSVSLQIFIKNISVKDSGSN